MTMLESKRNEWVCRAAAPYIRWRIHKAFNWVNVEPVELLPGHSVLYLGNHFSWWDGFLAGYVAHFMLKKNFYIMMQEDHIEKRKMLRYLGAYSLPAAGRHAVAALSYTAGLLNNDKNLVTLFPQGRLRSNHMESIRVEKGVWRVLSQVNSPCQVVYASTLIDYFESVKPSVYIRLHHCGTNNDMDYKRLQTDIQHYHRQDLEKQRSLT